jgi:hypothetical protein
MSEQAWLWTAGLLLAFLAGMGVVLVLGGDNNDSKSTAAQAAPTRTVTAQPESTLTVTVTATGAAKTTTVTAKPPPPKAAITADGTYLVGRDIKPGTYRAHADDELCYWARLSGTSGDFDDIIANGDGPGTLTVTIKSSDKAFETDSCGVWVRL